MRKFIALLFSLIPIYALVYYEERVPARAPGADGIKHIVFDLDGTLVESLGHGVPGDVVLASGEAYRVFKHAHALIERAWERGLQIHFFSGGVRARNVELLSKLKLANGQSYHGLAASISSFEDLVDLGEEFNGGYFTDRYRKDLRRIAPLDELVMLEDNIHFALDERQQKRVLQLPLENGGAMQGWWSEQRLAWATQALDDVLAGQEPSSINGTDTSKRIWAGLKILNADFKEELSRHGCAGIFMGLAF